MPFDDTKWHKPSIQADIGRLALTASIALDSIAVALINVKDQKDISKQIGEINKQSKKLNDMFIELTGYQPDAS